ncbi:hypothetical protein SAMN05443432_103227 [Roseovarius litoreus]|uniref:Uncharacterized protein n=1 Tax=Roseovarius litoreus TaxID=1155722 RepID=A0A1M7E731_9RHOB|nr:hypothetical protein [Roseovarius litoreus]SHL87480.1 hypothetical protein SAMN05443432_103227 [Roseovarius litoreus]
MFYDPVERFVRRAAGLLTLHVEDDIYRLTIRPGAPNHIPELFQLRVDDKDHASDLELIDSGAVPDVPPTEIRVSDLDTPDLVRPATRFEGVQVNLDATPTVAHFGVGADAGAIWLPGGRSTLVSRADQTVQEARNGRVVHHAHNDQRVVVVDQSNWLDDRDAIGPGAQQDMSPGLEGLDHLLSLARQNMAVPHDGERVEIGDARPFAQSDQTGAEPSVQSSGNIMNNTALMAQSGMEIGLMAVMGDAHITTQLMQINGLSTSADQLGQSENLLRQVDLQLPRLISPEPAKDVCLSLSVVDGDFYDIVQITQTQMIDDRDVIAWSFSSDHVRVASGDNLAANEVRYIATDFDAEVLIVEGNYIAQREIVQINLADDRDMTNVLARDAGAEQAAPPPSVTNMVNEAVLALPGSAETMAALPEELAIRLMDLIAKEPASENDLSNWDADGDGMLEVVLVRGDFYDVKSVRQTNILADSDLFFAKPNETASSDPQAMPFEPAPSAENSLSNRAVLIDATAGARSSFVAGNLYEDTLLLDANLLGDAGPFADNDGFGRGHSLGTAMDLPSATVMDAIVFDAPVFGT